MVPTNRYRMGVLEGGQRGETFDFIASLIIIHVSAFQNEDMCVCVCVCVCVCIQYLNTIGKDSLSIT